MTLPPETPREWRARVALIASIGVHAWLRAHVAG